MFAEDGKRHINTNAVRLRKIQNNTQPKHEGNSNNKNCL